MTEYEVSKRVYDIQECRGDDEAAHGMEDQLYLDVLHAIAHGEGDDPAKLAKAALASQSIEFARWCA